VNRLRTALSLQELTGTWTRGFVYAAKRLTSVTSPAGTLGYTYTSGSDRGQDRGQIGVRAKFLKSRPARLNEDDNSEKTSQPSHRLTGFSIKKALASVWLRATRHGYEKQKPKTKANEA
jgi:uncharacterized protein RhaS with RHS repeats